MPRHMNGKEKQEYRNLRKRFLRNKRSKDENELEIERIRKSMEERRKKRKQRCDRTHEERERDNELRGTNMKKIGIK